MHDAERLALRVATLVRVVQTRRSGRYDRAHDVKRNVAARTRDGRQQLSDILTMDVFHREEVLAVLFADVEHLHDVLVMKTRGEARFVDEHRDETTIACMLGADALEHDVTFEAFNAVGTA